MKRTFRQFLGLLSLAIAAAPVTAIEPEPNSGKEAAVEATEIESLDLFQAMNDGKVEVNFYPKDATQATVVFKNKTDKPLDLELPEAFGAIHVKKEILGQYGGGGMGGMGGGMGGMGGGMGGMFRVEPDKARKIKVPCMCLEHGKQDPNPRMTYRIVPIEKLNNDPRVVQLCGMLGNGKIAQNTAQAAAWHLANGLSWQELARKNRVESKYTGNVRFFHPAELQQAFYWTKRIQSEYDQYVSSSETSYGAASDNSAEESEEVEQTSLVPNG